MEKEELGKSDQVSHKVIEKRRRDRINICLSELSQTVPTAFSKQTSGKLEKAEILEMTVEYLRAIQATETGIRLQNGDWFSSDIWTDFMHHYQTGYNDCVREILRYMTDVEGLKVNDERCVRLMSYLQTRFHPDASVTSGSAYRQLKNVHRFPPFRSPYPIIDDIPHGDRHVTHSPRFRPYDFSIRPNIRHSDGMLTTKPITDCSPFSVLTSYGEVFRSTERQNSFNKFGNSK